MSQLSILKLVSSLISYSPALTWIAVGLVGAIFLIASFIFSYHWKRFGFEVGVMKRASLIYFSGSFILLGILVLSVAIYLNSL